jgi:membrane protease subunit HflC
LENLLRDRKNAVVGKHPLADFVSANPGGTKLDDIEREILAAVQAQLQTNNYGLKIEFLGIKKIGLPEPVTESVFARMKSDRNVLISKSQNEGEAEAQNIRSAADRKANEMLANADAEATRIKSLGEAAALQSQIVFQQNPQLAGFLLRLTALEQSLKDRSTLIFDQHVPPFDLFGGFSTNPITK